MGKKNVDFNLKKKYLNLTIRWCKNYFGVNERKRTKLSVELLEKTKKSKGEIIYGNYCFFRNKITIYEPACETIYDIVSTVIHEYTHYLQSRTKYINYVDNYYYSTNPYEREAKRNEEKYTKMCIKEVRKLLT